MTSPRSGSPVDRIFLFSTGRRKPYENLLTTMKSPIHNVGIMDPDGILNGSNRKERNTSTRSKTGKREPRVSDVLPSAPTASLPLRRGRSQNFSSAQSTAAARVSTVKISAKSRFIGSVLLVGSQNSQESFLRNFYLSHLLHAALAGFLLFEQLALAADIAAIALGGDILAKGLDG